MEPFMIRPREPTVLATDEYYELLPSDLWIWASIDTVHVVPGPIDIDRFNDALSRTLSVYPLAAGRIEKPSSIDLPWKIRLTNSPVPVTVVDSDDTQIFPTGTVLQNPLRFVQLLDTSKINKGNYDGPLLRVTLTRFASLGQTAIGVSHSHGIGDAATVARFLRLLSQNYQRLDALDPAPCYLRPRNQALFSDSPDVSPETSALVTQTDPCKASSLVQVNLRITATQVHSIRQGILKELNRTDCPNLVFSRTDIIIALITHSLSQADEPPVDHLGIVVNHRGMGIATDNAACNAVFIAPIEPFPQSHNKSTVQAILAIITQIRASLTHFRDIDNLSVHLVQTTDFIKRHAFLGRAMEVGLRPGYMIANSTWRFDWTSAHFGYPNQTRFHRAVVLIPRFVRILAQNPTLLPDGKTWEIHSGSLEATFFVVKDVKQRFEKILQDRTRDLNMPGEVEFV